VRHSSARRGSFEETSSTVSRVRPTRRATSTAGSTRGSAGTTTSVTPSTARGDVRLERGLCLHGLATSGDGERVLIVTAPRHGRGAVVVLRLLRLDTPVHRPSRAEGTPRSGRRLSG